MAWTIRRRLALSLGTAIVALAASGAIGIAALTALRKEVGTTLRETTDVGAQLFKVHDATLRFVTYAQSELLSAGSTGSRIDSVTNTADSLRRELVAARSLSPAARTRLERVGDLQGEIEVRLAVARAYRDVGRMPDAYRMAGLAQVSLDTLFANSTAIARDQQEQAATLNNDLGNEVRFRARVLGVLTGVGLIGALILSWQAWTAIAKPLSDLVRVTRAVGRGDLRAELDAREMDVEYQQLGEAVRQTVARLQHLIAEIQREAESLQSAAVSLAGASQQSAGSAMEISDVMGGMAQDATAQLADLEASTAGLDRVRGAVDVLATTVVQSRALGEAIQGVATDARAKLDRALQRLKTAGDVVRTSADSIGGVDEASQRVEGFVDTIASIGRKTHLLSINAAIEAARAGDGASGVATIADEVRQLAENSRTAAAEVRATVLEVRDRVRASVDAFRAGAHDLSDVGAVSRAAVTALVSIDDTVSQLEAVVADTADAADATSESVSGLAERLRAASGRAQSQASASVEAAAAAQQTAAAAQEVAAGSHQIEESATRLKELVATFKA